VGSGLGAPGPPVDLQSQRSFYRHGLPSAEGVEGFFFGFQQKRFFEVMGLPKIVTFANIHLFASVLFAKQIAVWHAIYSRTRGAKVPEVCGSIKD
jgi:hypothetical protein